MVSGFPAFFSFIPFLFPTPLSLEGELLLKTFFGWYEHEMYVITDKYGPAVVKGTVQQPPCPRLSLSEPHRPCLGS